MRFIVFFGLIAILAATPATAQTDALVGAWSYETDEDGDISGNVLLLSADGTFRWQVSLATNLDEFFEFDFTDIEFDEGESEEMAFFVLLLLSSLALGDGELTTTLEGEWSLDGEDLTLNGHLSGLSINDQSADEFFVDVFSALIADLLDLVENLATEEIPEGDRPTDADIEAGLAEIGMAAAAGLTEAQEEEIVQLFSFSINGDELKLFNLEEEAETVWDRIPLESAVEAQSWGQLKQRLR